MDENKIFVVKIGSNGSKSYETAVTLELPATWSEFNDALQKARVEDDRNCLNEIVEISRSQDYLYSPTGASYIENNVNLLELNLLAQRLSILTCDEESRFEGMLRIEWNNGSKYIPLPRLINLTFNTDRCMYLQARNYQELGGSLYINGKLPDEAMKLLDAAKSDNGYLKNLLDIFGKKHMEDMGGVFTSSGYVEPDGELQEVYIPGEMAYLNRTGAPVVLEVRKSIIHDPAHDNDLTVTLDLPADKTAIAKAIEGVQAVSADDCLFQCVDCLIPAARQMINNAIDEDGDINLVNTFAQLLTQKERKWHMDDLIKYKALLEASDCAKLEEAIWLEKHLDQYDLLPEFNEVLDYAEIKLRQQYPKLPSELIYTGLSYQIGIQMLRQDHAALTDYGLIRRIDGQPLPELRRETGMAMNI